jgi:2-dehydro-3-deoxygluconokinase
VEGVEAALLELEVGGFESMITKAVSIYPNLKAVAATLRAVKSATLNDWGAICWCDGEFHAATRRPDLEILDRVGGGDSFASGFIYGLMALGDARLAVEYGAAHGALAMTTPGDTTMASLAEVEKVVRGGGSRVDR